MSAAVIFVATLLSRLTGFVREIVMAAYFGTSLATDTWLMASVLPNLFFGAVNGALTTTIVPVMSQARAQYPARSVQQFVRELFTLLVVISLLLTALGELATPLLIHLIAPGFDAPKQRLTILMTRIMIPTILFWSLSGFAVGILQERERYFFPALSPVIINLVRIATIVVLGRLWGIVGVAVGFTLAVFSQLFLVFPPLARQGVRLRFRWRFSHPLLRRTLRITGPFFLASSVGTVGVIVDRVLASSLATGSIAALNYAYVLVQTPIGLIISSLATPIYTRLAQHHSYRESEVFRSLALAGLRLMLLVIVPITLWFVLLDDPLLRLLYQRGAFSAQSTVLTAGTLRYFALGLPGFALQFYLQRLFFATQDTRTPARFSVITIFVNVVGDLLLVRPMQADGLALATGAAAWVNAALLTLRATGTARHPTRLFGRSALGLAAATAAMTGALLLLLRWFPLVHLHGLLTLAAGLAAVAMASLLPYGVVLYLFGFPELTHAVQALRQHRPVRRPGH